MNKIKIICEKTLLFKSQLKNNMNEKIEMYAYYHQSLTFIYILIVMPIIILLAITVLTIVIMLPITLLFGYSL